MRWREACLEVLLAMGMACGSTWVFAQQPTTKSRLPEIEKCAQKCMVTIEGLRRTYHRGEHVEVSVRNQTKRRLGVVISVDGKFGREWVEIMGSVVEPDRPFAMVVRGTSIQSGQVQGFDYDPWTTLDANVNFFPGKKLPTVLRLVIHVHPRRDFTQIVSSETFQLVELGTLM